MTKQQKNLVAQYKAISANEPDLLVYCSAETRHAFEMARRAFIAEHPEVVHLLSSIAAERASEWFYKHGDW